MTKGTKRLCYIDRWKCVCNPFCPPRCQSKRLKVPPVNSDRVVRCEQTLIILTWTFFFPVFEIKFYGMYKLFVKTVFTLKCQSICRMSFYLLNTDNSINLYNVTRQHSSRMCTTCFWWLSIGVSTCGVGPMSPVMTTRCQLVPRSHVWGD